MPASAVTVSFNSKEANIKFLNFFLVQFSTKMSYFALNITFIHNMTTPGGHWDFNKYRPQYNQISTKLFEISTTHHYIDQISTTKVFKKTHIFKRLSLCLILLLWWKTFIVLTTYVELCFSIWDKCKYVKLYWEILMKYRPLKFLKKRIFSKGCHSVWFCYCDGKPL